MKRITSLSLLPLVVTLSVALVGCDLFNKTEEGPNDLGGDPNLDLTKVGGVFNAYLDASTDIPALANVKDTIKIVKNEGGIVTVDYGFTFDQTVIQAFDTLMGTSGLPREAKLAVMDTYLKRYGAVLDTSNKNAMTLKGQITGKVTSEGIQEFINSRGDRSKPFTIVKYASNVGDKYEYTNADGLHITRTVVSKSTTDDYPLGFWLFKVSKVEERKEDAVIDNITYVTNHKYGLIGVKVTTKNGKVLTLGIFPPTM